MTGTPEDVRKAYGDAIVTRVYYCKRATKAERDALDAEINRLRPLVVALDLEAAR
jgi:hypothetical protein